MIERAIEIARSHNYKKISVISGNGVKNYYRKFGFEDEEYFMTRRLDEVEHQSNNQIIGLIGLISIGIVIGFIYRIYK